MYNVHSTARIVSSQWSWRSDPCKLVNVALWADAEGGLVRAERLS
jgi:hypothetical protein